MILIWREGVGEGFQGRGVTRESGAVRRPCPGTSDPRADERLIRPWFAPPLDPHTGERLMGPSGRRHHLGRHLTFNGTSYPTLRRHQTDPEYRELVDSLAPVCEL